MRKLKLQIQTTLNGFVAKPGGELDWITWDWTDDIKVFVTELTNSMDTIILGRKLAEGFIPYWADVKTKPDHQEYEAGKIFTDTPKIVFSKALTTSLWDNTEVTSENLTDKVTELKNKKGKDIISYGGADFVSSLIKESLIDEYYLFVNPVAIKEGLRIFDKLTDMKKFKLTETRRFDCGINLLKYENK